MITSNVIQRIFRIKYGDNSATCFLVDVEGFQYFVTAKHVLQIRNEQGLIQKELMAGENVEIFRSNTWGSVQTTSVKHSSCSDVSVFTVTENVQCLPLLASDDGISYGQDLYFLGFPYGISSDIGELNRNFPLALVKKGILSSMPSKEPGKPFLIDGHNNPGFSGGPVIFKRQDNNSFQVVGIIHGFKPEHRTENGQLVPIENTNSGIIVVYSISNALELIDEIKNENTAK